MRPSLPTPSATPSDTSTDDALDVLQRSDEAMNRLRSARMHWETRSREGAEPRLYDEGENRFAAPDRMAGVHRFENYPEIEQVSIGRDRWERVGQATWTHSWHALRYRWPRYERYQREPNPWIGPVRNVVILREEMIDRVSLWVLSYQRRITSEEGPYEEFHTEWIDQETLRLVRSEVYDEDPWGRRALHVSRYSDFDAPMTIDPPGGAPPPGPPGLLAIPWVRR